MTSERRPKPEPALSISHPHLAPLIRTAAFSVGEFRCPGEPAHTEVERAPFPEIVLPRIGSYLRIDEAGEVLLNRGTLAFFEANRPYTIRHFRPSPDVTTVISIIDTAALHDALGVALPGGRAFSRSAVRMPADIILRHRQLLQHLRCGPDEDLAAQEMAAQIILRALDINLMDDRELARRVSRPTNPPSDPYAHADAASRYLSARFADRVSLEEVASAVGLSPFHLCRVFQTVTGVTVHQHLLSIRLEAAVSRLLETQESITEIAHAIGFSSHSHMTALFTRTFGMPPRSLRAPGVDARRFGALAAKRRQSTSPKASRKKRP